MASVNPDVLVWARETAGLSPDVAAKKLGFSDSRKRSGRSRLLAIEAGEESPTRSVLNRMAKAYRRSLLALMLPARPRMADRGEDFRTLPEALPPEDNALIDALIRNVRVRQAILRSAILDDEDFVPRTFIGSHRITEGVGRLVEAVEQLLGYSAADFRREANADVAFGALRSRVESVGVFVVLKGDLGNYHTAIEVEAFRGFAVADDVAPFIIINDNDSRRAWSFTLIHELVHLLLGQTGISGLWAGNQVEQFCNRVAGEYLLPEAELRDLQIDVSGAFEAQMERIGDFAGPRNVSSTMIAYKLYLSGRIDFDYWVRAGRHFKRLWRESRRDRPTGPVSYYVVRQHRVGKNLIGTVDRLISEGSLTETEGARVLDVRANRIQALIDAA